MRFHCERCDVTEEEDDTVDLRLCGCVLCLKCFCIHDVCDGYLEQESEPCREL